MQKVVGSNPISRFASQSQVWRRLVFRRGLMAAQTRLPAFGHSRTEGHYCNRDSHRMGPLDRHMIDALGSTR